MRMNVSQANPECPAIAELANVLESRFPEITLFTTNNVSPGTRHTAGVAIDIMLDSTKPAKRQLADGLIAAFVKRHDNMQWSDLIYTDFHIPARGGYGGDRLRPNSYTLDRRHFDHIHLDWVDFSLKNTGQEYLRIPYQWSKAAETTKFTDALNGDLVALAAGGTTPVPVASAAWIDGWWTVVQGGIAYYYFLRTADGSAAWTYTRPASSAAPPPTNPDNRGLFAFVRPDRLTITWDQWSTVATKETFRPTSPNNRSLQGTSNRAGPLSATKL